MKTSYFQLSLLFALAFTLLSITSCSDPEPLPLTCDSESHFKKEGAVGTMLYLPCYESWSIKINEANVDGDGQAIIAASLDIPTEYHVADKKVKLDACFYDFDLPLILPDPAPWGDMYVIKDYNISTDL